MRALTVRQPNATLITLGVQTIWTSKRSTDFRGPLVIHAGKRSELFADSWVTLINASTQLDRLPLAPLGAIVGTCNLVDVVPILDPDDLRGDPTAQNFLRIWPDGEKVGKDLILWRDGLRSVVTDQLPYGDFTPSNFAWILEDAKPTTERCPACWGTGLGKNDSSTIFVANGEATTATPTGMPICSRCIGYGYADPIPVKGKQGLWTWNP